ncbi:MAG TPA: hypothetical protein PLQ68_04515 [Clostridia bacterium]|nr:hypothetical protein [Clostridia bacterium]
METRKITINISEEQAKHLDKLVELLNSDYSKIIRNMLDDYAVNWNIDKKFAEDCQLASIYFLDFTIYLKCRMVTEIIKKNSNYKVDPYVERSLHEKLESLKTVFSTNRDFLSFISWYRLLLKTAE